MALTRKDLKLIAEQTKEQIDAALDSFLIKLTKHFATKKEVSDMIDEKLNPIKQELNIIKDDIVEIKTGLNIELPVIQHRSEEHTSTLNNHEKRIVKLEMKGK